jgi:hypothetical protein
MDILYRKVLYLVTNNTNTQLITLFIKSQNVIDHHLNSINEEGNSDSDLEETEEMGPLLYL